MPSLAAIRASAWRSCRRQPVASDPLLEAAGAARADELQEQMQVHVPAVERRRRERSEEAAHCPHAEADQEQRTDVQARQALGVARLLGFDIDGVADLEDPHVFEPRADPGQRVERLALQHLRPALRERTLRRGDGVDALAVPVEQRKEYGVGIGGLAQDVEALANHRIGVAGSDVLEIDRDLCASEVNTERRALGPRLPKLRRQDIGSRELGKRLAWHLRYPDGIPLFSSQFLAVYRANPRNQLTKRVLRPSAGCVALCQKCLGMQGNRMYLLCSLCHFGKLISPDLTTCGLPSASRCTFQRR